VAQARIDPETPRSTAKATLPRAILTGVDVESSTVFTRHSTFDHSHGWLRALVRGPGGSILDNTSPRTYRAVAVGHKEGNSPG
jgi:hypothetical protein